MRALAKLKKTNKRHNTEHANAPGLHVMSVGCMDLCPKDAITVKIPFIVR